jgi:CBS domain containing-hemolysin-like protein
VLAHSGETLRQAADRMLASGRSALLVLDDGDPPRVVGVVRQSDLLKAHERVLVEERVRERPLRRGRSAPASLTPASEPTP